MTSRMRCGGKIRRKIVIDDVTDALERDVGGRIAAPRSADRARNGPDARIRWSGAPPYALHGRENAQLVIDHDVVPRRVTPLDVVEHRLLVNVDQHVSVDAPTGPSAAPCAAGTRRRRRTRSPSRPSGKHARWRRMRAGRRGQRTDSRSRKDDMEQARIVVRARACSAAMRRGNRRSPVPRAAPRRSPVTVAARSAERLLQVIVQVGEYAVVFEQRIVDVEEKGDVMRCMHSDPFHCWNPWASFAPRDFRADRIGNSWRARWDPAAPGPRSPPQPSFI